MVGADHSLLSYKYNDRVLWKRYVLSRYLALFKANYRFAVGLALFLISLIKVNQKVLRRIINVFPYGIIKYFHSVLLQISARNANRLLFIRRPRVQRDARYKINERECARLVSIGSSPRRKRGVAERTNKRYSRDDLRLSSWRRYDVARDRDQVAHLRAAALCILTGSARRDRYLHLAETSAHRRSDLLTYRAPGRRERGYAGAVETGLGYQIYDCKAHSKGSPGATVASCARKRGSRRPIDRSIYRAHVSPVLQRARNKSGRQKRGILK